MRTHAEYCSNGDYTLESTQLAIADIVQREADDYFVVVLSDANFGRYGLEPEPFGKALTHDVRVSAFAIFIASFSEQAEQLKARLPVGRSFVCLDTSNLPTVFKQIFTSSLLAK